MNYETTTTEELWRVALEGDLRATLELEARLGRDRTVSTAWRMIDRMTADTRERRRALRRAQHATTAEERQEAIDALRSLPSDGVAAAIELAMAAG